MQKEIQPITCAATDPCPPLNGPRQDLSALGPDELRNRVQKTLSTLCEADRKTLSQRLLTGLAKAGVQVDISLFILGIPVSSMNDLTPSDAGKLLRYIYINLPAVIEAMAGLLAELLITEERSALIDRRIDEAA